MLREVTMTTDHFQPIILIGAARSGTKLVRDLIATHPNVDKVPYDINYVWRLGNEAARHDELSVDWLTPRIRKRILCRFATFSTHVPFLIEKTVSNCLRVPYVQAIFPEARFIHLVRNGYDVVESVHRQWLASPDWRYILGKAKTFPLSDACGYAFAYARDACLKFVLPNRRQRGVWGPHYVGVEADLASKDLLEVCAIQWARCVELALKDLSCLPIEKTLTIRYEDFVTNPHLHLAIMAEFIGLDPRAWPGEIDGHMVSDRNIHKGLRTLSLRQRALIQPYIQDALSQLNYEAAPFVRVYDEYDERTD
jgi:hypothetical protein